MWRFRRQRAEGFDSWPIVRSSALGKAYGRSISVLINNMQCHLSTVEVYEDGAIDCWGFVDRELFQAKLDAHWVVAAPQATQSITVANFGTTGTAQGRWHQSAQGIADEVNATMRALNPKMQNLIEPGGLAKLRAKVRYALAGSSTRRAFRKVEPDEEVLADSVPVLRAHEGMFELTRLMIYADGFIQVGPEGELLPIEQLSSVFAARKIANRAPVNAQIRLPGLGEFRSRNEFGDVSVHDRIGEIHDKLRVLRGEPSVIDVCVQRFADYAEDVSPEAKRALREAYNAVPHHLRRYCGDAESRDKAIRAVLFGTQNTP
jgi:hypothetical protein